MKKTTREELLQRLRSRVRADDFPATSTDPTPTPIGEDVRSLADWARPTLWPCASCGRNAVMVYRTSFLCFACRTWGNWGATPPEGYIT